jgi:amidohydrolase
VVRERLAAAGLETRVLPGGTGVLCDIGSGERLVALRADLDALPIPDSKDVPYRSLVDGVCHACGHDVHTSVLVGAGLVLAKLHRHGALAGRVRLVFQPAEEQTPGGALDVLAAGGLEEVERIFALHCDPRTPVGQIGVRAGALTASADHLVVRVHGPGGHTARPHLTGDLVHALATVVTGLPAALSRRVDPRSGLSVVWGRVAAGAAPNAIPRSGEVEGTLRCLEPDAWQRAPELVTELVSALVSPYGVVAEVDYRRGVPPVVNDEACAKILGLATREVEGSDAVVAAEQSLGGEDFAWYLDKVPGSMARLGTGTPLLAEGSDLHQSSFDVDERAIAVGVRVLAATALLALR